MCEPCGEMLNVMPGKVPMYFLFQMDRQLETLSLVAL